MGRQQGLDEEKLRQLPEYEVSQVFERDEVAALRYADALTATPAEVPDEVYAELREVFDEVQIVELTSALAWEN